MKLCCMDVTQKELSKSYMCKIRNIAKCLITERVRVDKCIRKCNFLVVHEGCELTFGTLGVLLYECFEVIQCNACFIDKNYRAIVIYFLEIMLLKRSGMCTRTVFDQDRIYDRLLNSSCVKIET